MVDPLPPYPPPHDAWRFPPPPVSRRWLWGAVAASLVAGVALVSLLASVVIAGTRDLPASIDDPELIDAIDLGCMTITNGIDEIDLEGVGVNRASQVTAQNTIVRGVVDSWNGLDADLRASDRPFDDWVADWQRLLDARDGYVEELAIDPNALFTEPEVDGEPLVDRMNSVVTGCTVPRELVRPDRGIERDA